MAKKFGALADFRQAQIEALEDTDQEGPTPLKGQTLSGTGKPKGRPAGKRSNPEYEPTTLLLRKLTKRKASRLLEDTSSKFDLSDLIETLLGEWISKHS